MQEWLLATVEDGQPQTSQSSRLCAERNGLGSLALKDVEHYSTKSLRAKIREIVNILPDSPCCHPQKRVADDSATPIFCRRTNIMRRLLPPHWNQIHMAALVVVSCQPLSILPHAPREMGRSCQPPDSTFNPLAQQSDRHSVTSNTTFQ